MEIFEDYFLDKDKHKSDNSMKMAKHGILKELNEALIEENATEIRRSTRFYLKLPLSCAHQNHPVGSASKIGQYVNPRVVKKFMI